MQSEGDTVAPALLTVQHTTAYDFNPTPSSYSCIQNITQITRSMQHSLLFQYGFLKRLMFELRSNSASNRIDIEDIKIDITAEEDQIDEKGNERKEERKLLAGSRCPLLGHLVQIAQVRTSY